MAIHSNILAWKTPQSEEPGGYSPLGHKELDTAQRLINNMKLCLHSFIYSFIQQTFIDTLPVPGQVPDTEVVTDA